MDIKLNTTLKIKTPTPLERLRVYFFIQKTVNIQCIKLYKNMQ